MGNGLSLEQKQAKILQEVQAGFAMAPGLVHAEVFKTKFDGQSEISYFILLGEQHRGFESFNAVPLFEYIVRTCFQEGDEADIFFETALADRMKFVNRRDEDAQKIRDMDRLAKEGIDLMRTRLRMNCPGFRVHAIDPRNSELEFIPKCEALPVPVGDEEYNYPDVKLLEETVRIKSYGMQVLFVKELVEKGNSKTYPAARPLIKRVMKRMLERQAVVDVFSMMQQRNHALLDIYSFQRMLRPRENKINIFYGGAFHSMNQATMFAWLAEGHPGQVLKVPITNNNPTLQRPTLTELMPNFVSPLA